jgi:hypothetical protein
MRMLQTKKLMPKTTSKKITIYMIKTQIDNVLNFIVNLQSCFVFEHIFIKSLPNS